MTLLEGSELRQVELNDDNQFPTLAAPDNAPANEANVDPTVEDDPADEATSAEDNEPLPQAESEVSPGT